jgi:hypothetical protein
MSVVRSTLPTMRGLGVRPIHTSESSLPHYYSFPIVSWLSRAVNLPMIAAGLQSSSEANRIAADDQAERSRCTLRGLLETRRSRRRRRAGSSMCPEDVSGVGSVCPHRDHRAQRVREDYGWCGNLVLASERDARTLVHREAGWTWLRAMRPG